MKELVHRRHKDTDELISIIFRAEMKSIVKAGERLG